MKVSLANSKLIQSYVLNKYFVSTAFRESSACVESPPCYFETIAWAWNPATRECGEMLLCEDSGRFETSALKSHFAIVANLIAVKEEVE